MRETGLLDMAGRSLLEGEGVLAGEYFFFPGFDLGLASRGHGIHDTADNGVNLHDLSMDQIG